MCIVLHGLNWLFRTGAAPHPCNGIGFVVAVFSGKDSTAKASERVNLFSANYGNIIRCRGFSLDESTKGRKPRYRQFLALRG